MTRRMEEWELNPPFISPLLERGDRGDFSHLWKGEFKSNFALQGI